MVVLRIISYELAKLLSSKKLSFADFHAIYYLSIISKFATKNLKEMRAAIRVEDPATSGTQPTSRWLCGLGSVPSV